MSTSGEQLFKVIVEESKKKDGTWSYHFLQDIRMRCKKLHEKQLTKCFTMLIDHLISDQSTTLEKYKIAQLMSILKFQFLFKGFQTLDERKATVEKYLLESMPTDALAVAAKKLIGELFVSLPERAPAKIHAYSSQPIVY